MLTLAIEATNQRKQICSLLLLLTVIGINFNTVPWAATATNTFPFIYLLYFLVSLHSRENSQEGILACPLLPKYSQAHSLA